MKTLLLSVAALFGSLWIHAQYADVYQTFINHTPSGILLEQKLKKPAKFWTPPSAQNALITLKSKCVNQQAPPLPEALGLAQTLKDAQQSHRALVIGGAWVRYHYLDTTLLRKEDYRKKEDGLEVRIGASVPLDEELVFIPLTSDERITQGKQQIVLDRKLLYGDAAAAGTSFHISTDGKRWQPIAEGTPITLEIMQTLYIRATRGNSTAEAGMQLRSSQCSSGLPELSTDIPWQYLDDAEHNLSPWEIRTVADNGQIVSGNAYYLASGAFDKPFIFVEGIDFSYYQDAQRNGDFGWCEFTSASNGYEFLGNLPGTLQQLHQDGFDIILVDFADGAGDITMSSALVKHLLRMVNFTKQGNYPSILAGASMGGVVTRYTLADMERTGENHCIGLWISLDAPHRGANVPFGLQQMIFSLADEPQAAQFITNFLRRPATKQLLILQYDNTLPEDEWYNPSQHLQFYQNLENLGFPRSCKSLGVANGNMRGRKLWENDYDFLMDENCDVVPCSSGPEARFFITSTLGDPWYNDWWGVQSNGSHNVSGQMVKSDPPSLLNVISETLFGGLFGGSSEVCDFDKYIRSFYIRKNQPAYDNAPGGTRNSLGQFAWAINSTDQLDGQCTDVTIYKGAHCFIPTYSALAMMHQHPPLDALSILEDDPGNTPFDDILGPMYENEAHSHVSLELSQRILEESRFLTATNGIGLPEELSASQPNNGHFNMGRVGCNTIGAMRIHSGGHLTINSIGPQHFGENPDQASYPGSHFKAFILPHCSGSDVIIESGGMLSVGDPGGLCTATLVVRKGARLITRPGSKLVVYRGSRLIVEEGGIVELNEDAEHRVEGSPLQYGHIELKEGGTLVMNNSTLKLDGQETKLISMHGRLEARTGKNTIRGNIGECGQWVCPTPESGNIEVRSGASLRIEGHHINDVVIECYANAGARVSGDGELILYNAAVRLEEASTLSLSVPAIVSRCRIYADGTYDEWPMVKSDGSRADWTVNRCEFVDVQSSDQTILIDRCTFMGNNNSLAFEHCIPTLKGSVFKNYLISNINATGESRVLGCEHYHEDTENAILLNDQGEHILSVKGTHFNGGNNQVRKSEGRLVLGCNRFQNSNSALFLRQSCSLVMSGAGECGRNIFANNKIHVLLRHAGALSLDQGENTFGTFGQYIFFGSIYAQCGANCNPTTLHAQQNYWLTWPGMAPSADDPWPTSIAVRASPSAINTCAEEGETCPVWIVDSQPISYSPGCYEGAMDFVKDESKREATPSSQQVESSDIKITAAFPNPLSGTQLSIAHGLRDGESILYKLVDTSGRTVQQWNVSANGGLSKLEVSMQHSSGLYLLHQECNGTTGNYRIMLQR